MKYCLMACRIGEVPEIEIDSTRFKALKKARETLIGALSIEEKYDLLFSNYIDLERECLNYATESMVKGLLSYEGFSDARQNINRKIVNFLTSARLYVDHIQKNIKSCLDDSSGFNVKAVMSKQYDKNFSYRFMEALRNYVQHSGLAIHYISTPTRWVEEREERCLEFRIKVFSDREVLKESKNFKAIVLREMPEKVDIVKLARSYMASINIVHISIREAVMKNVEDARKLHELAIDEYKNLNNGKSIGLRAIKYEKVQFPKDVIEDFPVLLEWDDFRIRLQAKNGSVENLGKRFVSGASY